MQQENLRGNLQGISRFYLYKLGIVALVASYFVRFFFMGDDIMATFLHGFILMIHEAGHLLTPFGYFAVILGGTLWQLFVPLIFVVYFFLEKQFYSAALLLFLVGFSFVDASVYVRDAQERLLPLITNDIMTHDWWQLLRMMDLLAYDDVLANLYYLQGWLFFGLGCYFGVYFSQKRFAR
jgi:hypothetical protein